MAWKCNPRRLRRPVLPFPRLSGQPWSPWIALPRHFGIAVRSHQCASAAVGDKEVSTPRSSLPLQFLQFAPLPADYPWGFSAAVLRSRHRPSSSQNPPPPLLPSSPLSPTRRPSVLRPSPPSVTACP